ncbi:EAP30/Vps36 family-domain-containing protein [Lipomyces arxii]|uniref:EAP30/Vps36 family-domain-containing protein n=1 Tax=Lipomyces arxii TaxID=56418 RepID=UPI0034CF9580
MLKIWTKIDLTAAHRPVLFPDETDILVQNSVGIYEGRVRLPEYQLGRVYLTSHRICYVDNASPLLNSVAINLADVKTIQYAAAFFKSSPKITLHMSDTAVNVSSSSSVSNTPLSASPNTSMVSLNSTSRATVATPIRTATPMSLVTWTCPICSFSNSLPTNYKPKISQLPACSTCGVKPPEAVIMDALAGMKVTDSQDESSGLAISPDEDKGLVCSKCTFINNSALRFCEMCGARLSTTAFNPSDYILDKEAVRQESYLPFTIGTANSYRTRLGYPEETPTYVKISFRASGDKPFFEKLQSVIAERQWLINTNRARQIDPVLVVNKIIKPESEVVNTGSAMPNFGIHGLQSLSELERARNKDLIGSLNDLHTLMTKARDMVKLAESFATRLATLPGVPDEARRALRESSQALSLSSPIVTKEMAGGGNDEIYIAELARQLAEFLDSGVLKHEGGIVTLFDLFALYNRARGISLISPKDLNRACAAFDRLGLPFRVRQFKSGLTVVQEASKNDEATVKSLVDFVKFAEKSFEEAVYVGVSAEDVSAHFGWSVGVCVEELETAQELGLLCSDAIIEGTRYYINIIDSFVWDAAEGGGGNL